MKSLRWLLLPIIAVLSVFSLNHPARSQGGGSGSTPVPGTPPPATRSPYETPKPTKWICKCIGDQPKWFEVPDTGMAFYRMNFLMAGVTIYDQPLTYRSAFGPEIPLIMRYDSHRDARNDMRHPNFGPMWEMNWVEWVTDEKVQMMLWNANNPVASGNATLASDGSLGGLHGDTPVRVNDGEGGTLGERPGEGRIVLRRITPDLQNPSDVTYRREYPDGWVITYAHPLIGGYRDEVINWEIIDGQPYPHTIARKTERRFMMTAITDPAGNTVTLDWNERRLNKVTDATGKWLTFVYDGEFSLRIKQVTDPYGRAAKFTYFSNGYLQSITDPAGITSSFTWQPGTPQRVDSLSTPYGTTTFEYEGDEFYNGVTVAEPNGSHQKVMYYVQGSSPPSEDPDSLPPENSYRFDDVPVDNAGINHYSTYYWDRQAMHTDSSAPVANARIIRWMSKSDGTILGQPHSVREPGKNRVWFGYHDQEYNKVLPDGNGPAWSARMIYDESGTLTLSRWTWERNSLGHIATITDPVGRVTQFGYHANHHDLYTVEQKRGAAWDVLAKYEQYQDGIPKKITDAAGKVTWLQVNGRGQVTEVKNPRNEITTITYGAENTADNGRLTSVTGADGTAIEATTSYSYDSYGRVDEVTQPGPYSVTFAYDAIGGNPLKTLDRLRQVTYPDGTTEESTFLYLDVSGVKDRLNRWTLYEYDASQNLTKITDPAGRTTAFDPGGCCGSVDALIDGNGNRTEWIRDVLGRTLEKRLAVTTTDPGTTVAEYDYDPLSGRLSSITDALGNVKEYSYTVDGNLAGIHYEVNHSGTAPTGDVSFTYDPDYDRLLSRTDGQGGDELFVSSCWNSRRRPTLGGTNRSGNQRFDAHLGVFLRL